MSDSKNIRRVRLLWVVGLLLAIGTVACYWPVFHFDFVTLDDPLYVSQTPIVSQGLSWPGFVWAFQCIKGGNWNPMVWLSHMVGCQLFGPTPSGHHLINLLLHIANVLLLFLLLRRMTGAMWRSGFVAALFAWHPMHIESVAWISERKDVLSTLFWLLSMCAYARYADELKMQSSRYKLYYALALLCFVLGLMCKPMLVTLPFTLLLLDYWPLGRIYDLRLTIDAPKKSNNDPRIHAPSAPPAPQETRKSYTRPARSCVGVVYRKLIWEKVPFFLLAAAASMVAVWAQHSVGAIGTESLPLRLENVTVSYVTYLGKFFWPVNLAVFYPYPDSIPLWQAGGATLMLATISGAVIWGRKRCPYLAVGWLWFLGTFVPVIGLLQVGMQSMADRYTYIPFIGLGLMLSWGLADLAKLSPRVRLALTSVAVLSLGCFVATARSQLQYWRESKVLYKHALNVTSRNYMARENLGNVLMDSGKYDEALKQFQKVVEIIPTVGRPYNELGKAYAMLHKMDDALAMFTKSVTLDPGLPEARWNLGSALLLQGNAAEGIRQMKIAAQLDPENIEKYKRLVDTLIRSGKAADALPYCEAVIKAEPGNAYARFVLGSVYLARHDQQQAVVSFKEALRLAPDKPQCMNALAWIYGTGDKPEIRNGPEAVRLAEEACKITQRQNTQILDTLAAAYAEVGRFEDAIKTADEIRALAISAHDTNTAETAQQRLELYKSGKPYRDAQ